MGRHWREASHHYTPGEGRERGQEGQREWMMHNMLEWRRGERRENGENERRTVRGRVRSLNKVQAVLDDYGAKLCTMSALVSVSTSSAGNNTANVGWCLGKGAREG